MSSPPSDTSEGVLVSRPPSPTAPHSVPSALPQRFRHDRHDSPVPHPVTLVDTPTKTVTALAPSSTTNTDAGLGRVGREELDHLQAPPLLGRDSAEGVVGAAQGRAPEYIASVRKATQEEQAEVGQGEATPVPPAEVNAVVPTEEKHEEHPAADDVEAEDSTLDEGASATGGKKQPKWFRKVKEQAASLKEKAADVVASASSSTHSTRNRSDSAASSTLAPESAVATATTTTGGSPFGRARTRSVGSRSNVSFAIDDPTSASAATSSSVPGSARTSLDVPRPIPKIVTDRDGHPVPVSVGDDQAEAAAAAAAGGGGNVSTSTSVKDKILESGYDVEPHTTNEKFHSIFKDIPEDEELIEDYRCALVRDILVQGKLYVSENFLSFRANILGWETSLKIPWSEIISIEKRMTAKIIPNAIEVRTLHATHTFSSFVARDASYSLIASVFRHVNPGAEQISRDQRQQAKDERRRRRALSTSSARSGTDSEDDGTDAKSEISFEDEQGEKKRHRFKIRRGIASAVRSIKGRDTAAEDGTSASAPAEPTGGPTEAEKIKAEAQAEEAGVHPPTEYAGPEFKNEALDCVIPTSPFKAFVLFFKNEAFLKNFLETKENLREVELRPWRAISGSDAEADDRHALKQREMSYIKPLNAPVGPKQTKCNIEDKNEKIDEESWIANLTTTKTPDVPSGNDFSTVTRTVFTWAPGGATRVRVTTEVEWTKVNRFLRGVIERGAIDGQKQYHKDLEAAVRAHIAQNPGEFAVAGAAPAAEPAPSTAPVTATSSAPDGNQSEGGGSGFLDGLGLPVDILALSLGILAILLLFTNLYTYLSLRSYRALATSARLGHPGEVSAALERVLTQFNSLHARRLEGAEGAVGVVGELGEVRQLARAVEGRLQGIAGELGAAMKAVGEVADRLEGVRGMI